LLHGQRWLRDPPTVCERWGFSRDQKIRGTKSISIATHRRVRAAVQAFITTARLVEIEMKFFSFAGTWGRRNSTGLKRPHSTVSNHSLLIPLAVIVQYFYRLVFQALPHGILIHGAANSMPVHTAFRPDKRKFERHMTVQKSGGKLQ
jgi:hypothetical protein